MGTRTDLELLLESILGSTNLYFQPPPSLELKYPCIIYKYTGLKTRHANNKPYSHSKRYTITVIDKNPDSLIPDRLANLSGCSHDRNFVANNLNHYVFNLYF